MIEFLCAGKKSGKSFRCLFKLEDIESVVESPTTSEVSVFFRPKQGFQLFGSRDFSVDVLESYEAVCEKIEKEERKALAKQRGEQD